MKVEFRKIPLNQSEFEINFDSVKFLGTFSKITSKLAKIDANLSGNCTVDCCKCGKPLTIDLDENISFLASDGIYTASDKEEDKFVIVEVEDHILDFDDLLHSEIESQKSEYYVCSACEENKNFIEIEY